MLLRLPDPAARFAVLVLALSLAVTLSFFSVRNARAAIEAGLGTRAGYEAAARLEPTNPENWYLLGRYWSTRSTIPTLPAPSSTFDTPSP